MRNITGRLPVYLQRSFKMGLQVLYFILLLNIYRVTCVRNSSLTFVIDDTRSMGDDISQVRVAAKSIMKVVIEEKASEIEDVVLVTFNDPDVVLRTKTSSFIDLKRALDEIEPHNVNNRDCPEYALSGIERALRESRPNSYIFVFTDASAKDYQKREEIKRLCEEKQSQVVFVLTGYCWSLRSEQYTVYREIARACSGQVFLVAKEDVGGVISTIRETVKGHKTVVTWKILQPSYYLQPVEFTVDDKTDYVIISTSGDNVELYVTNFISGIRIPFERIFWNNKGKVVKFIPRSSGKYNAWVHGSSEISIVIYARTDFTFEHGFSEMAPKSQADTRTQPIAGRKQYLSISVTDPEHVVAIKTAEIIDMSGTSHFKLPLKRVQGDFYITDTFVAPNITFKIMITGMFNGKIIKRFSRTTVEPQPPPKAAEITIIEGAKVGVDYGADILLTCKVSAYPAPTIVWTTVDGTVLDSKSYVVSLPYDYVSYLKIPKVVKSQIYHCRVSNEKNSHFSKTEVKLRSPIRPKTTLKDIITVLYGAETNIVCDLTSSLPIRIDWYHETNTGGKIKLVNSESLHISQNGSVLIIKSTDLEHAGKYTCEASLISEPSVKLTFTTDVQIQNLNPPVFENKAVENISVGSGHRVTISCKIAAGVPRPTVSWEVMKNDDKVFKNMPSSGEELIIEKVSLADAGKYRCVAMNAVGTTVKISNILVKQAPLVIIKKGLAKSIPYGSNKEFTCEIKAFPLPNVAWKDSRGNKLHSQNTVNDNVITSRLQIRNAKVSETYYCYAENELGRVVDKVHLKVDPAISKVHTETKNITTVLYGAESNIVCDLTSLLPIRIDWYHETNTGEKIKLGNSESLHISQNGSVLIIKSTDLEHAGKYTCEASLISEPSVKLTFTTDVQIQNLNPPVFASKTPENVTVESGYPVQISCKIIGGVPRPTVSWEVMKHDDKIFKYLPSSGEELIIEKVSLADAGKYRCVAKNAVGTTVKTSIILVKQAPLVIIKKGLQKSIPYGSNHEFTCEIKAFPLPNVAWKDSRGNKLHSQNTVNDNVITSRLQIRNAKVSETYYCYAENDLGRVEDKVHLTVEPAITLHDGKHSGETTSSKYGTDINIDCGLMSPFPILIKWFHETNNGKSQIVNSEKYQLSQDKSTLQIKSIDLDQTGKYTCEASLVSEPNIKKIFTTVVQITDLRPPTFKDIAPDKIIVISNMGVNIQCKFSDGVPRPTVRWQFKKNAEDDFSDMPAAGAVLTVASASLANSGFYRCIVKNIQGQINRTTELIVQHAPSILTDEETKTTVPYGSTNHFSCRVNGYPVPKITWTDGTGNTLKSTDTTKDHVTISSITVDSIKVNSTFTCHVENTLGSTERKFDVSVSSPFVVHEYPKAITSIHYGASKLLLCNITSVLPLKINWYYQSEESSQSERCFLKQSHCRSGQSEVVKSRIVDSDNLKIAADGSTIQIISMGIDLVGKYTCQAALVSDESQKIAFATNVQIDDLKAPEISNTENVYYGLTGDVVLRIPCNATGVPKPTITWKQNGRVITSDSKITITNQAVHIKNPTEPDSKNLTCEATNELGAAKRTFEAVVSDFIDYDNEQNKYIYLLPKDSKDIKCDIPHVDPNLVRWYLNGDLTTVRGSIYPLKNVDYINDGNYTCRVSTDEGATSQNYVVDVGYKPYFKIQNKSPIVNWNGDKESTLDCAVHAKPKETVEWFFNGKPRDNKDNYFNELPLTDWGEYTCKVSNVHGTIEQTVKVTYEGCVINRTVDSIQNTPLLITDEYTWPSVPSENEFLVMEPGEKLTLLCSTDEQPSNTFKKHPSARKIEAICDKEDQFLIDGKTFRFKELLCEEYVKASVVDTHEPCLQGSKVKIGFNVDGRFLNAYDVCYDEARKVTLYTKVLLDPTNMGNKAEPSFKSEEDVWKHDAIIKCQFNHRHFVNPVDVAFGPAQIATLSRKYNEIQVYEPCDGSSMVTWSYIDETISSSLDNFDSVTVWTGGSNYDSHGIPRYLWKVLKPNDSDIIDTVVYVNAPQPKKSDILCSPATPNVLEDFNTAPNTYDCDFEEFLKVFNIPASTFDA